MKKGEYECLLIIALIGCLTIREELFVDYSDVMARLSDILSSKSGKRLTTMSQ